MVRSNPINIVLLERCYHPLTGPFDDGRRLDEPLDSGQIMMLRIAIDRMAKHVSGEAKDLIAVTGRNGDIVPVNMNAGEAKHLSRALNYLWERTPDEERRQLAEWFRDFNSSPGYRSLEPSQPSQPSPGSCSCSPGF